jgi:hypothetical protein
MKQGKEIVDCDLLLSGKMFCCFVYYKVWKYKKCVMLLDVVYVMVVARKLVLFGFFWRVLAMVELNKVADWWKFMDGSRLEDT